MSGRWRPVAGLHARILKGCNPWLVHQAPAPCMPSLLASHPTSAQRICSHHSQPAASVPWRGFATSSHSLRSVSSLQSGQGQTQLPVQPHLEAPPVIISPYACRIVLVGWMGSKKRYLQKYSHLWQRSGEHEVLSLRTSIPMTLMRWRGVVTAGTDIDRVARLHIENPAMPTFYHIFSTGGFIHAGTMWRWMDQVEDHVLRHDLLGEVKGIIFDSAPAKVNEDMASRAVASALLGMSAEQPHPVAQPLAAAARTALSWYLQRPSIRLREEEVYHAWDEMAPICPQLYLYSEADPLVPPQEVEEWMKLQESRGVEVHSHKWQDSGHCEHYRNHPQEYAFQISQFMSRALKDW